MADAPLNPVPASVAPAGVFDNPTGATIRPLYVERRPPMWAVAETDLDALSLTTNIVNAAFAIGSFCLGFAVNIWVSYEGAEKLTPVGDFMLHRCTIMACAGALFFYGAGAYLYWKRSNLWDKIKSESRQVVP